MQLHCVGNLKNTRRTIQDSWWLTVISYQLSVNDQPTTKNEQSTTNYQIPSLHHLGTV